MEGQTQPMMPETNDNTQSCRELTKAVFNCTAFESERDVMCALALVTSTMITKQVDPGSAFGIYMELLLMCFDRDVVTEVHTLTN
jgi:hypothetical protein